MPGYPYSVNNYVGLIQELSSLNLHLLICGSLVKLVKHRPIILSLLAILLM